MVQSRDFEHEMYEAAAGITWHAALEQTFFYVERVHSKIMIKTID